MNTESRKKSYKKYNEKSDAFSICYRPAEIAEAKRLRLFLKQTDQTANAYIKHLIKADLDARGISYPEK